MRPPGIPVLLRPFQELSAQTHGTALTADENMGRTPCNMLHASVPPEAFQYAPADRRSIGIHCKRYEFRSQHQYLSPFFHLAHHIFHPVRLPDIVLIAEKDIITVRLFHRCPEILRIPQSFSVLCDPPCRCQLVSLQIFPYDLQRLIRGTVIPQDHLIHRKALKPDGIQLFCDKSGPVISGHCYRYPHIFPLFSVRHFLSR